jgi:site-specific DNA-cytosine methylase
MASNIIRAADLFCGAGGTSTGLLMAVKKMGFEADLLAINHWDIAIATHTRNHEKVRHLCQNLDKVDPAELIPGGRLDVLVASPECKHHSNARGGKPRSDQRRADAWLLSRWIEKLYVDNLLIENVREFVDWGPLGADGLPLERGKGEYFRLFVQLLEVTYRVEWKIINCADYGDPTTRERFFLMARRPRHKQIVWPEPTHASPIVLKQRLAQVEHLGLVQPYLVKFYGTGKAQSIKQPLGTVTANDRFGLVIPQLGAILDIRFRMLQPHELAAAMSFPKGYEFAGTREDKVAQIGNAVPVKTAQALVKALLSDRTKAKTPKPKKARAKLAA